MTRRERATSRATGAAQDEAALRARRRALLKAHHPDLGGDTDRFVEVLAALDATSRPAVPPRSTAMPARTAVGVPSGGARRRRRALARSVRGHLPRRVPGARRYATY